MLTQTTKGGINIFQGGPLIETLYIQTCSRMLGMVAPKYVCAALDQL